MNLQLLSLCALIIISIIYVIRSTIIIKRRLIEDQDNIWEQTYNELKQNPYMIDYSDGMANMIENIIENQMYKYIPNDLYDSILQSIIFGNITHEVLYYILDLHSVEILELIKDNKQTKL